MGSKEIVKTEETARRFMLVDTSSGQEIEIKINRGKLGSFSERYRLQNPEVIRLFKELDCLPLHLEICDKISIRIGED